MDLQDSHGMQGWYSLSSSIVFGIVEVNLQALDGSLGQFNQMAVFCGVAVWPCINKLVKFTSALSVFSDMQPVHICSHLKKYVLGFHDPLKQCPSPVLWSFRGNLALLITEVPRGALVTLICAWGRETITPASLDEWNEHLSSLTPTQLTPICSGEWHMKIPLANTHWPFLKMSELFGASKCDP